MGALGFTSARTIAGRMRVQPHGHLQAFGRSSDEQLWSEWYWEGQMVGVLVWPCYPCVRCVHDPILRCIAGLVFLHDANALHKQTMNQGAQHIINPKQAFLMTLPCPGMNPEQQYDCPRFLPRCPKGMGYTVRGPSCNIGCVSGFISRRPQTAA